MSTVSRRKADFQHDFNMLPGSSQEPFPWAGEHKAPYSRLQDRGRERLSQVQKKKPREHGYSESESWEG